MTDAAELVPTMRLRWQYRQVSVAAPFFGGGVRTEPVKFLQQWWQSPAADEAVGAAPGEWRDVPLEVEP